MTNTEEIVFNKQSRRGFEIAEGFEEKGINLPKRGTTNAAGYDFESAETILIPSYSDLVQLHKQTMIGLISEKITGQKNLITEEMVSNYISSLEEEEVLKIGSKTISFLKDILELFNDEFDTESFLLNPLEALKNISSTLFLSGTKQEEIENILGKDTLKIIKASEKSLKPILVKTGIKAYMQPNEFLGIYNRSSNPMKKGLVLTNGVGVIDADYYENESNDGHIMGQFINFSQEPIEIKKGERIFQGIFQPFLLADGDIAGGKRIGGHGSTGN